MKLKEQYIYLIGGIALILASIFSLGNYHPDEHFQILEFAGLKLGFTDSSSLPWEYHSQMRPAFQPAIVVGLYRFLEMIGMGDPFVTAFLLRFLSAVLSFLATWLLYKTCKDEIADARLQKWYFILSFLLWFVVFNGVRFSSENWSGAFFVIGFSLFFLRKEKNPMTYIFIGFILGLSFLCRYQAVLLTLGFLSWLLLIRREKLLNLVFIGAGAMSVAGLGLLIDRWFYREWTLTLWHYFEQNILHDKVSGFGVEPWWYYVSNSFMNAIPPFSLLFIIGFFVTLIFKPKSAIVWSIVPFLLIHSIIGHKELRFVFPIIPFMPYLMIRGIDIIREKYFPRIAFNSFVAGFMKLFLVVNAGVMLVVVFSAAKHDITLFQTIYSKYTQPLSLYYLDNQPYGDGVLTMNFYKRENLALKHIDSLDEIPESENGLVILNYRTNELGALIYTSYPDWLLRYNFNNWQARSRIMYVYELKR